jgi:hypothetical protein
MSSFLNSRTKTEKKVLALDIVAFSFLYIFLIALIYLLWNAYLQNDIWQFSIYPAFCLIYLVCFFLVIRDIHQNYDFFIKNNDIESVKRLETVHFLCSDPLCSRCGGWYFSLALSFSVTVIFKETLIDFASHYAYSQYCLIIIGALLFLLSTPLHGAIAFLRKFHSKVLQSKKLKLFMGMIAGLSLMLIVIGILMLL